ncbi:PAS domain S-box-containing protein/diguanylate cyclase (GGDEF) domain-containing protein [Thiohalospira halophila DSM 15071]|uniref:Sensor protein FixL n=1 Tax=Thiohalospira halophila DSM 15071 TaxID=1123397 RepID=A0A1I1PII6_9GAMM|nr:GGDEF domain-containing phosphodiesterase [Thiohalospira halophila]SFD07498.1 PAS domain S-box-containing protein/diguanylate cyclase (GGDEF) domain-containing protein [Thiohalospira halophila DSM 15071]
MFENEPRRPADPDREIQRLDAILRAAGDAIITADADGVIHDFNPAAEAMFGYTADQMVGTKLNHLMPEPHATHHDEYLRHYEETGEAKVIGIGRELEAVRADGSRFPIELNVTDTGLRDPRLFIGVVRDISERRQREAERLHFYANFDALTGLPNRDHALELLDESIRQCPTQHRVALMEVRLRSFRHIGPTYGQRTAEQILRQVANRLRDLFRDEVSVRARLEGSRFLIGLEYEPDPPLEERLQAVMDRLSEPYKADGQEFRLRPRMGVAECGPGVTCAADLLRQSEIALARVADSADIPYAFADPETDQALRRRLNLETDLHRAVGEGEFFLDYQPQFQLSDGRMTGVEALLRWNHPERGVVSPAEFIPLLEDTGLIIEVGRWILDTAAAQAKAWNAAGLPRLRMAVNLSPLQVRGGGLLQEVMQTLARTRLPEEQLELEITESLLIEDLAGTRRILETLQGMGIRLALDDFGSGFSALSYLHAFPFHTLKVDRTFIHAIGQSDRSEGLLRSIIEMGQNLRMEVVAEGIETEGQAAYLRAHGCELGQGFGLARPGPPEAVPPLLTN